MWKLRAFFGGNNEGILCLDWYACLIICLDLIRVYVPIWCMMGFYIHLCVFVLISLSVCLISSFLYSPHINFLDSDQFFYMPNSWCALVMWVLLFLFSFLHTFNKALLGTFPLHSFQFQPLVFSAVLLFLLDFGFVNLIFRICLN